MAPGEAPLAVRPLDINQVDVGHIVGENDDLLVRVVVDVDGGRHAVIPARIRLDLVAQAAAGAVPDCDEPPGNGNHIADAVVIDIGDEEVGDLDGRCGELDLPQLAPRGDAVAEAEKVTEIPLMGGFEPGGRPDGDLQAGDGRVGLAHPETVSIKIRGQRAAPDLRAAGRVGHDQRGRRGLNAILAAAAVEVIGGGGGGGVGHQIRGGRAQIVAPQLNGLLDPARQRGESRAVGVMVVLRPPGGGWNSLCFGPSGGEKYENQDSQRSDQPDAMARRGKVGREGVHHRKPHVGVQARIARRAVAYGIHYS
ncbi:MAG: hypothetical protein BWZ08_01759 [candidate division BRC1 bacterium ADurb.BinA292]|nr:MAG: hypothetical protein BWZ08_01759 [candidate division BRC1 bacterium ADurb.BinA292]